MKVVDRTKSEVVSKRVSIMQASRFAIVVFVDRLPYKVKAILNSLY